MRQITLDEVSKLALEANHLTADAGTVYRAIEARSAIARLRANPEAMDAAARQFLERLFG